LTSDYTDDTDAGRHILSPTVKSPARLIAVIGLFALCATPALQAQREKIPAEDLEYVEKTWPEAKKTMTGIRYVIMREGEGPSPKPGDKVNVNYVGRLLNGKVFDQNNDPNQPFTFRVRRDMVIEGWDQILQLMKKGEKRLVIIPPELGYGTRGQPPKIGRNATLVFEIEWLAPGVVAQVSAWIGRTELVSMPG
jgi:FKBP-type peptidyl-prolyl cis-trans isomerase